MLRKVFFVPAISPEKYVPMEYTGRGNRKCDYDSCLKRRVTSSPCRLYANNFTTTENPDIDGTTRYQSSES